MIRDAIVLCPVSIADYKYNISCEPYFHHKMEFFKLNLKIASPILLLFVFFCTSKATICEKEVDCTYNDDIMDCRSKNLDCLPPFGRVKTVRLSRNNIVKLTEDDFPDKKTLNELDMGDNKITEIEDNTFRAFDITNLILNFNFISKLSANTFGICPKMNSLDLSFNNISFIDSNTFSGLNNLEILNLERNPIFKLPDSLFFSLNKLRTLSLRQTNLYKLSYTTFNGVEIEDLNLQGNHLQTIPTDMFSRAQTLLKLNLDENPVKIIGDRAFKPLFKLHTLSLKNMNHLTSVEAEAFSDLISLQYLDMAHNRNLKDIHKQAFQGINAKNTNLTNVNLRGNSLVKIDFTMLPWSNIRLIDLEDNPLLCDCNLLWMRRFRWDNELTSDLLCDSPKILHGMLLMNVKIEQFQCKKSLFPTKTVIIAIGVTICILLAIASLITLYRKKCVQIVQASQQIRYSILDDKMVHSSSEWISPKPEEKLVSAVVDV